MDDQITGLTVEGELRLLERPRTSLVGRYDMFDRRGDLLPAGSSLSDPDFDVHRATWGFTITLPGGILLLLNHEHWFMPDELDDVDVIGARWVGMFSAP